MPKTVNDWTAKGWIKLDLSGGQSAEVAYDQSTQDIAVKGQVFGTADGKQLKGKARPKLTKTEHDGGCTITASQDATVFYKLVDQEDDADDAA